MDVYTAEAVIAALGDYSIVDFIAKILHEPRFHDTSARSALVADVPRLLKILTYYEDTAKPTGDIMFNLCTSLLRYEVATMATKNAGWHFSARNASVNLINEFSVERMAEMLTRSAPRLWELLGSLLLSDPSLEERRIQHHAGTSLSREPSLMSVSSETSNTLSDWDEEDEYWSKETDRLWENAEPADGQPEPPIVVSEPSTPAASKKDHATMLIRIVSQMLLVPINLTNL